MLQYATLPASLAALLWAVRPCFTAPTFGTFCVLVAGMIAQPGRRTVCGMWVAAGLSRLWHHGRAHWFFARARWSTEQVGLVLAQVIVAGFVPAGAPVLVAVDDTLFRRSGRRVAGAAWQHDGGRKGPRGARVSWGTCFVVAGIVVWLPFLSRPVCLPVAAVLWRSGEGQPKTVLAGQMIHALAARLWAADPGRVIDVVADAHYAGADGAPIRDGCRDRGLPAGVSLTSRLRVNAVFNAIATPIPGRPGRPKRIGARLGTPTDLGIAATRDGSWRPATVTRYGRADQVDLTEFTCLWYGAYRSRTIRVVLLRDPTDNTISKTSKTSKTSKDRPYDLALITTDLTSTAAQIVERYAARWSIEVTFEDARQHTGVGEARNRTTTAVERTVPFGLYTHTIVIIWYTRHGHNPAVAADRRAQAPWYTTKAEPAYHDMIIKLRRVLITAKFRGGSHRQPTDQETLAIHLAWAEAAA